MSFEADLILADESTYSVRRFSWGLRQRTDAVGRPEARVQGGQLEVVLDSAPTELLHHWALDDTKKLGGQLVVYTDSNRGAIRKTIKFKDAYCVGLHKNFDGSTSNVGMTMTLSLSADQISSGTVSLKNSWPT
ncbi:hypothetical protein GCM10027422_10920 [Hymenobacter arcticus]